MWNLCKAEHLKLKHTFGRKLPLFAPVLTILLVLSMTMGIENSLPSGAWNWWYIMLLPGMLAILCCLNVKKDKKLNFYHMLSTRVPPRKSWAGKIMYCGLGLLVSNLIVFAATDLGGRILGTTVSAPEGFFGAVLLSITYLWEVPLYLFLSARFGMFASLFTSMVLSVTGVAILADTKFWWAWPAAVPVRLMCPVLGIKPNGLPVPGGSELLNPNVILPGVLISMVWFLLLLLFTSRWFDRWEAVS